MRCSPSARPPTAPASPGRSGCSAIRSCGRCRCIGSRSPVALPDLAGGKAQPLFTIGYEAKTLDEFLSQLVDAGVELVVDVRAVAASRRPGFSKTALAGALAERGLSYLHLRALGTPKEGRDAARRGDTARMRAVYADHLATGEAALAFAEAREAATERLSALLCFERDAVCCHRAMVAERLRDGGSFRVVDL